MIVGVGIDVVPVARFAEALSRTPTLAARLFTAAELVTESGAPRSAESLAARFAAKEALAKALGAGGGMAWTDAEVRTDDDGRPSLVVSGTVAERASSMDVTRWHVSLSHDGGIASATVIAEGAMKGIYPVEDLRSAEATVMATLPEGVLMQRAAHALAVECAGLLPKVYGARVVLFIGAGNNGGDALFAGAELADRGARVTALLLDPEHAHADGLLALDRAGGRTAGADVAAVAEAELVVDGIVGIGGRGGLRGPAIDLARAASDVLTVAVDVPSGVDADTGWAGDDVVHADVTVTFGALKAGLVVGPGAELVGELRLVDIGLDPVLPAARTYLLEADDIRELLPHPDAADDKYTRGVVGIAAGSVQYAGAGVLATGSAVHGGAGMVRYVGLAPDEIRARYPEVIVHPDARPHDVRVQAWVVGPGLGTDDTAMSLLSDVLRTDVPVIIDADAITLVARSPGLVRARSAPTVLTPHDREFARIAGEPSADRLGSVRRAAARSRRDRAAQRQRDRDRRPGWHRVREPDRHAVAGNRGQRRRAQRADRIAARRRTGPAVGRSERRVRPRRRRSARRRVRPISATDVLAELRGAIHSIAMG